MVRTFLFSIFFADFRKFRYRKVMKVVVLIQARMGSERFPGKVLKPLVGTTILGLVVEKVGKIEGVAEAVVATSTNPLDDAVEKWCRSCGVECFRGAEHDVLQRFIDAMKGRDSDTVVRITADCPLLDPHVCALVLDEFRKASPAVDYAVTKGFPRGLDTEVVRLSALEEVARRTKNPEEREHVTLHLYRNPDRFRIIEVESEGNDFSEMRWTVDTPEDFAFVESVFAGMGNRVHGWREILRFVKAHPEISAINQAIVQKNPDV